MSDPLMLPHEIRAARLALGLSPAQLGKLLETDAQTIRRMEMDPVHSTSRKPAVRMCRLIRAYLEGGYRPADWPVVAPDWDGGSDAGEVVE